MSNGVNDLMAECMDMVRQDLIDAGVIAASIPPMMVSDAVIAKVWTQAARIAELEVEREHQRAETNRVIALLDAAIKAVKEAP
jgi:hypothetical protein